MKFESIECDDIISINKDLEFIKERIYKSLGVSPELLGLERGLKGSNPPLYTLYTKILKQGWRVEEQTHNHGTYSFWIRDSNRGTVMNITIRPR